MGKRKLRFDQRKNYERKKYGFRVKIQLALLTPHELVHLSLSAYFGADARNASVLLSRLQRADKIPNSWVISHHSHSVPASSHPFMLCKLQQCPNVSTPTIMFSITFDSQCLWTLCVESRVLVAGSSGLLFGVEITLRSVDAVARLVSLLCESKFCVGNSESKFIDLVNRNRGTFKDRLGKNVLCTSSTIECYCFFTSFN